MEPQKKITVTVWIWQDHSGLAASHNSSCLWAGSGQDQLWGRISSGAGSPVGQDQLWGRFSSGTGSALGQDQFSGQDQLLGQDQVSGFTAQLKVVPSTPCLCCGHSGQCPLCPLKRSFLINRIQLDASAAPLHSHPWTMKQQWLSAELSSSTKRIPYIVSSQWALWIDFM